MNNKTSDEYLRVWSHPGILWSVIFQERRLPIELCRIIFLYSFKMNNNLRLEILGKTVQKKWKVRLGLDPGYCQSCGEYNLPTLIGTGDNRSYCLCQS